MNKPEKLILDYSKWRCGGDDNPNSLGKGPTWLLNNDGFSCCLGQFERQLGASDKQLLHRSDPCGFIHDVNVFVEKVRGQENLINSRLSGDCIDINDEVNTTPDEKINLLKDRLGLEGIQLEVINKP